MYSLKYYPNPRINSPMGLSSNIEKIWTRKEIEKLYRKHGTYVEVSPSFPQGGKNVTPERIYVRGEDNKKSEKIIKEYRIPKKLFDLYPSAYGIVYYNGGYQYYFIIQPKEQFTLIIKDEDLPEIKRQLDPTGIKSIIQKNSFDSENVIVIPNGGITEYYILTLLLKNLPDTSVIFDSKIDYLGYFLQNETAFITSYLDNNIKDYPRFLELTEGEPSYQDLVIDYGFKYIYSAPSKVPSDLIIFVDAILARPQKISQNEYKEILKLLFMMPDSPNIVQRRNRVFILAAGLPLEYRLPFDVKLDIDTLLNFGRLLK